MKNFFFDEITQNPALKGKNILWASWGGSHFSSQLLRRYKLGGLQIEMSQGKLANLYLSKQFMCGGSMKEIGDCCSRQPSQIAQDSIERIESRKRFMGMT